MLKYRSCKKLYNCTCTPYTQHVLAHDFAYTALVLSENQITFVTVTVSVVGLLHAQHSSSVPSTVYTEKFAFTTNWVKEKLSDARDEELDRAPAKKAMPMVANPVY
eukprot:scpid111806/ scgid27245/ 